MTSENKQDIEPERMIDEYLRYMTEEGASDLHMSAGELPTLRVDGDIERFGDDDDLLDKNTLRKLIYEMMTEEQKDDFEKTGDVDFSYSLIGVGRFRVNVFMQQRGIGTILRRIPEEVLTMGQLGMEGKIVNGVEDFNVFKELANAPKGLVLVTGPTGSGKSTTLAAMIDYINKNKKAHILTIEDPIEFVHKPDKAVFNQREVHKDTESFDNALRAALRQDPDVILVGEMRDLETIKLAMSAAETGHVVFGTLHTNSATKTIDRIIDVFPASEKPMIRSMLSESLVGVVSQALLKRKNGGRVAAHEVMIATSAIRSMIREDKVPQMYSVIQTGSQYGMKTLDQSLEQLVDDDIIDVSTARSKAFEKSNFQI